MNHNRHRVLLFVVFALIHTAHSNSTCVHSYAHWRHQFCCGEVPNLSRQQRINTGDALVCGIRWAYLMANATITNTDADAWLFLFHQAATMRLNVAAGKQYSTDCAALTTRSFDLLERHCRDFASLAKDNVAVKLTWEIAAHNRGMYGSVQCQDNHFDTLSNTPDEWNSPRFNPAGYFSAQFELLLAYSKPWLAFVFAVLFLSLLGLVCVVVLCVVFVRKLAFCIGMKHRTAFVRLDKHDPALISSGGDAGD